MWSTRVFQVARSSQQFMHSLPILEIFVIRLLATQHGSACDTKVMRKRKTLCYPKSSTNGQLCIILKIENILVDYGIAKNGYKCKKK